MPTCLNCGIRVPVPEEWERDESGRKIKPCACGLPAEIRRKALAAQERSQYDAMVFRLARTPWPVSAILRVVKRGNSDAIFRASEYLARECGPRYLSTRRTSDKNLPNPRFWARLREDLLAAMGGEEENIRREAEYCRKEKRAAEKTALAFGVTLRQAWELKGSGMKIPRESVSLGVWGPHYDPYDDGPLVASFLYGDLAWFVG